MEDLPAIAGGSPVRTQYLVFGSPSIGEEEILEVCREYAFGLGGNRSKGEEDLRRCSKNLKIVVKPLLFLPARQPFTFPFWPWESSPGTR